MNGHVCSGPIAAAKYWSAASSSARTARGVAQAACNAGAGSWLRSVRLADDLPDRSCSPPRAAPSARSVIA